MTCSRDLTRTGKESLSLIIGGGSKQDYDEKAVDLVSPILLKKQKLLVTGPSQSKYGGNSHQFSNLVKKEHLQFPENVCDLNPQDKEVLIDEILKEKRIIEPDIAKHKDVVSETVSKNSNETKGSAFLVQVKYL